MKKITKLEIRDFLNKYISETKEKNDPIIMDVSISMPKTNKKNEDGINFYEAEITSVVFNEDGSEFISHVDSSEHMLINSDKQPADPEKFSLSSVNIWTLDWEGKKLKMRSSSDEEMSKYSFWYIVKVGPFFTIKNSQSLFKKVTINEMSIIDEYLLNYTSIPKPKEIDHIIDNEISSILNEEQKKAFTNIIRSENLSIIKGPPGTGKTTVIEKFLHYSLTFDRRRKIIFATNLHSSIDAIFKKVNDNPFFDSKRILRLSKRAKSVVTPKQKELQNTEVADVYVTTFASQRLNAIIQQKRRMFENSILIVDEASAANLFSVLLHTSHSTKIIIIGDDNQLSPIYDNNMSRMFSNTEFKTAYEILFTKSLFNYVYEKNVDRSVTLLKNYRSVSDIVNFINFFYDGKLIPHDKTKSSAFETFSEFDLRGVKNKVSELIMDKGLSKDNTIFICDYKKIVESINKTLKRKSFQTLTSTQGDEADNVVLVLTKNPGTGNITSQLDFRSINVAISRSRKKVYIIYTDNIINEHLIDRSDGWRKIRKNGNFVSIGQILNSISQ